MVRCNGVKNDERCHRRVRVITPKGAIRDLNPNPSFTCENCKSGRDPFVPRESARKGQQKNAKSKKK